MVYSAVELTLFDYTFFGFSPKSYPQQSSLDSVHGQATTFRA